MLHSISVLVFAVSKQNKTYKLPATTCKRETERERECEFQCQVQIESRSRSHMCKTNDSVAYV